MSRIAVMGAGIGGLTFCHVLKKIMPNVIINVYERHDTAGGQARSTSDITSHSEYCWHAIGNGYNHLIPLLKEIPIDNNKTVYDSLKPITNYMYGRNSDYFYQESESFITSTSIIDLYKGIRNCGGKLTLKDMVILSKLWIKSKRLDNSHDEILWTDMTKGLSDEALIWFVKSTSIFLGMDTTRLSSQLMLSLMNRMGNIDHAVKSSFSSFDGPINKVWFDPWVKNLSDSGVNFHFNSDITSINDDNIKLSSGKVIYADLFINALPIEAWAKLTDSYEARVLSALSLQTQTQVLFKFNGRINLKDPSILMFPDSKWCLMARHEGSLWNLQEYDYLSVGIGLWDSKGLCGKDAKNCDKMLLATECWNQMKLAKGLMKNLKVNNKSLFDMDMPEYNIWNSFEYDNNKLYTYEPKFSNNVGTLKYRPSIIDSKYSNILHSTAYVKTTTNIFCMESAVEAGKKAAYAAVEKLS